MPPLTDCDHPRKRWNLSDDRTEVFCGGCNAKVADVRPVLMRWLGTGKRFTGPDPKPAKGASKRR